MSPISIISSCISYSYSNTAQHQDKVGNWEEKNSTLHVLPTISTDVCINTESQDNDSEIIGSNVTELVHGNVCFENQRSEVENSHCSVINEQMPLDVKRLFAQRHFLYSQD
jgi:hypothetical protein